MGPTHLASSSTGDDLVVLDRSLDDHDRVVQTSLHLRNELLGTSSQDQSARLGLRAVLEQVESLSTNLPLLKLATLAQVVWLNIGRCRLDRTAHGLSHTLEVVRSDSSSAEDIPVGKVLRRKISDGQLRQDHLGARVDNSLELAVDDRPLRIDDGLVFRHLVHSHLRVVLLRLQLELHIETQDLRVLERLRLLLESGVRERFLESHSADEQTLLHSSSRNLLHTDERLVEVVLVEREDGVDGHGGEKGGLGVDEFGGHGSSSAFQQEVSEFAERQQGLFCVVLLVITHAASDLSIDTAISLIFLMACE